MKLLARFNNRRGIAMTEYLIILAVVAIAAIAVVGLFGKQIKQVFTRSTGALAGEQVEKGNIPNESKQKVRQDNMRTFEDEAVTKQE
jgi:Flp pilus assembly pilin Flp